MWLDEFNLDELVTVKILLLWWIQADSFQKQFWCTSKRTTAERSYQQAEIDPILQKVINMASMLYLSSFEGKSTLCCKLCRILQYLFTYIICSTRLYGLYNKHIILIVANRVYFFPAIM